MNDTEKTLKELGRKTMFNVSDAEMPALLEDALKNAHDVQENQIKVPKVVG